MNHPGEVNARQLQAMLHDGSELALLDVREPGQFGESHLLFATPLPYSRLEIDIAALVPRRTTRIVLCDDGTCEVAQRAARRLAAGGFSNVALLSGGTRAWAAAGYALFAGVNVPSKLFGELVEHEYHTPRITAQELVRMKVAGDDFILLDGRTVAEHRKMTIPGSISCPNAELPYRLPGLVNNPATKIVVNCAGRTRSILGAQTLINFGVRNPVFALENGTQGWSLADLELEYGADRAYSEIVPPSALPGLQEAARRLMARHHVSIVRREQVENWLQDETRTLYLLDVRTPAEFAAGSLRGAVHAEGGQLVQATDQWVGVRNARIVLADGEMVRAPVVASWLMQLGCDVHVLEDGVHSGLEIPGPQRLPLPRLRSLNAAQLHTELQSGRCAVLDLGPSMAFRKGHLSGSTWSIRARVTVDAATVKGTIVLVATDPQVAAAAAVDLQEAGKHDILLLEGGLPAWIAAGYPTAASAGVPPDRDCIDYLFFVHDRHAGNREAMKQYLAWETGLMSQLSPEDRQAFRIGRPA